LREEHRLRVFKNRVLRRIFGRKRNEVTGEWRKFNKEELHDLYSSPNIVLVIKPRMRRGGTCSLDGEGRSVYRVSVEKPEGKSPVERPRRR
jgi:hypothetical protein